MAQISHRAYLTYYTKNAIMSSQIFDNFCGLVRDPNHGLRATHQELP